MDRDQSYENTCAFFFFFLLSTETIDSNDTLERLNNWIWKNILTEFVNKHFYSVRNNADHKIWRTFQVPTHYLLRTVNCSLKYDANQIYQPDWTSVGTAIELPFIGQINVNCTTPYTLKYQILNPSNFVVTDSNDFEKRWKFKW